jgi:hypothetical protein
MTERNLFWALGGDITLSGLTAPEATMLGRSSPGVGPIEAIPLADLLPPIFTDVLEGSVPASGGGTLNFIRADGTWAVPPGTFSSETLDALDLLLADGRPYVFVAGGDGFLYGIDFNGFADGSLLAYNSTLSPPFEVVAPGAASITALTTASVPYDSFEYEEVVVDAGVTALSQIMVTWGTVLDTDENGPLTERCHFGALPAAGSFTLTISSDEPFGGPFKLNYLVG